MISTYVDNFCADTNIDGQNNNQTHVGNTKKCINNIKKKVATYFGIMFIIPQFSVNYVTSLG